jgi:hypothetical protein
MTMSRSRLMPGKMTMPVFIGDAPERRERSAGRPPNPDGAGCGDIHQRGRSYQS